MNARAMEAADPQDKPAAARAVEEDAPETEMEAMRIAQVLFPSKSRRARAKNLFRRIYDYIIRLHGSPEDIAWGLALGLFIAMSPTVGFQMIIAVPIAGALRINPAAAALGVWLTNPLTIPFLYGINYFVGASILGYSVERTFGSDVTAEMIFNAGPGVFLSLILGGAITGAIAAAISYFPTLYMVRGARATARRRRERKLSSLPPDK